MSVPSVPAATVDADRQAAFAATLVDEWVRAGVRHAVVCPGSRSTPLALAVAAEPRLALHVRLDERSAGFTALGIGMATGRPAVVVVTSGTAAAELHAAVVEADLARVPLLVCTADRPPELRDVGAPQTIDQTHLYGRATRWTADPGVPDEAVAPDVALAGGALGRRCRVRASGPGPGAPQPAVPGAVARRRRSGRDPRRAPGRCPVAPRRAGPSGTVRGPRRRPRDVGRPDPRGPGAHRRRCRVWRPRRRPGARRRRSPGRCWPIHARACVDPAGGWCRLADGILRSDPLRRRPTGRTSCSASGSAGPPRW